MINNPQGIPTESPMISPKVFPPMHFFPSVLLSENTSESGWLIACELIVSHEDAL